MRPSHAKWTILFRVSTINCTFYYCTEETLQYKAIWLYEEICNSKLSQESWDFDSLIWTVFILWDQQCCLSLESLEAILTPATWNTSRKTNYSLHHKWYKLQPLSREEISQRTALVPSLEFHLHFRRRRSTKDHKLRDVLVMQEVGLINAVVRQFRSWDGRQLMASWMAAMPVIFSNFDSILPVKFWLEGSFSFI